MAEDLSIVAIAALLPLTSFLLVFQVNPYHALVIRGIVGAVAALVYALFGAADVALTEALVGTMLSITLYAVAVRSSMSIRLGVLENELENTSFSEELVSKLRQLLNQSHLRLELVPYNHPQGLQTALMAKEIHGTSTLLEEAASSDTSPSPSYHLQTRIQRIYDLLQEELPPNLVKLTYVNVSCKETT